MQKLDGVRLRPRVFKFLPATETQNLPVTLQSPHVCGIENAS